MTREEAHTLLEVMAIELTGELADIECPVTERTKLLGKQLEAIDMAIEALAKPRVVFLCDGRKCGNECSEMCFRTTDVSHAKNFVRLGDAYFEKDEKNDE